ncbi:hypothetical protein [Bisbaumannia pacifica]|nr:hypothetical protein [Halomonas pacifica]
MIALSRVHGAQRLLAGEHDEPGVFAARPRWPMDTLTPPETN